MNSRFEIRPVASRRLRAALLLVLLLGWVAISQTRLSTGEMLVAHLALITFFVDGWRRTRMPACRLIFKEQPLGCALLDAMHNERLLRCKRASVYPWLIVLQFEQDPQAADPLPAWLNRAVVLLPDSLDDAQGTEWRRLLVWSHLMRRQLALHS